MFGILAGSTCTICSLGTHRLKVILTGLVLVVSGAVLVSIGNHRSGWVWPSWTGLVPWGELGGILIGAGVLSVWVEQFFRREQDAATDLRFRHLLHDQAPAMRDAVLDAFAANHADLARVATTETLDQIITNSLALRLHDPQFASEIFKDIRQQAIEANERWYDASLSVTMSPQLRGSGSGGFFTVTVRWEYTTIPRFAERRFLCTSDRQEYTDVARQPGDTSAWYLKPATGVDARTPEAFELVAFAVNGVARPIRRSQRRSGQLYTASIGAEHLDAGEPVTVSYTYRTITTRHGHLLFFDIEHPTRDLRVEFSYDHCNIGSVNVLDLIPSTRPTRIEHTPLVLLDRSVRIELDGWIFPRSGVAFVWVLEGETRAGTRRGVTAVPGSTRQNSAARQPGPAR